MVSFRSGRSATTSQSSCEDVEALARTISSETRDPTNERSKRYSPEMRAISSVGAESSSQA